MKINMTLDLDDETWAALTALADIRGVPVAAILERETLGGLKRLLPHLRPRRPHTTTAVRGEYRRPGDMQNPYHRSSPFEASDSRRDIVLSLWKSGQSTAAIARMLGGETKYRGKVGATIWAAGYDTGTPADERHMVEAS